MNNNLFWVTLLLFFSSLFFERALILANDLDQPEISRLIQEINAINPQEFGLIKNYCVANTTLIEKGLPALVREKPIVLKCPLTTASLCSQVGQECSLRYSKDRRAYLSSTTIPNPVPKVKRYVNDKCFSSEPLIGDANSERSKKILAEAAELFYKMTRDDSPGGLQQICCDKGLNAEETIYCRNDFKQTRLVLLDNTNEVISRMMRNKTGSFLEVSRSRLENCLNLECIETLFFHELGHACDSSRRVAQGYYYHPHGIFSGIPIIGCSDLLNEVDNYDLLGEKTSECIKQRLDLFSKKAEQEEQTICFSAWKAEALADAIFSEKYNSFAHFAWSCTTSQDRIHSQDKVYLSCIIEQPKVHDHFCPKK